MMLRAGCGVVTLLLISCIAYAGTGTTNDKLNTVKLKPKVRESKIIKPVTTLSLETLRPFIKMSVILEDKKQFLKAPSVIAEDKNRIEGGPGTVLYVLGTKCREDSAYGIYRAGRSYKHPCTGEKLGFEAISIGSAELIKPGDPAVFDVVTATESIEVGSRLLPSVASSLPSTLTIHPAKPMAAEGFILSVRDGINQAGRNQVVLISLGQREGLVAGDTLDIMQNGRKIVDPTSKGWRKCFVQLPDLRIGSLLVFQTYEKLSLGLILESTEMISLLDKVKSP
ncbi:MAG TPA: hypothetical protein PK583_00265 [Gammaproteobacteria bacterium]|nr:hypothetical protein [Gammaproteobacteria bacterium]HQY22245.1 hypothetical protein [Gammaproteobacteria bacterium]HQZ87247.1 hypothetical protein [Gammaproteobacteria bacterium]HRA43187.1 hypothetical protein [Gammaproteobacteria bacterium]